MERLASVCIPTTMSCWKRRSDIYDNQRIPIQGHVLDREHMALELGDVAWYLALAADALGYDLETILRMNIEKLQKRYPNGFEKGRSISREEGDI